MRVVDRHIVVVLLFIIAVFVMTSCATILSGRGYNAFFYTEVPNSSLRINDSEIQPIPSKIRLENSRRNLYIEVLQNDSIVSDTLIRAHFGNSVMLGNYFFPPGIIIDFATGRGFTYGEFFVVDSLGRITRLRQPNQYMRENLFPVRDRTIRQHQQGNFNILLSLPYANFFHLNPQNETPRNSAGFWGFGVGVEYFYRNNRSLQLRGDAIMDYFLPVPVGVTFGDNAPRESITALNINLTDNFHINRFRLGYGLNFARNSWTYHAWYFEENEEHIWTPQRFRVNNMLGLALSTHYRFANRFYFGVIYRPSFFEISRRQRMYEHSISLDFMWKIFL